MDVKYEVGMKVKVGKYGDPLVIRGVSPTRLYAVPEGKHDIKYPRTIDRNDPELRIVEEEEIGDA